MSACCLIGGRLRAGVPAAMIFSNLSRNYDHLYSEQSTPERLNFTTKTSFVHTPFGIFRIRFFTTYSKNNNACRVLYATIALSHLKPSSGGKHPQNVNADYSIHPHMEA
jgi:hypothetical protein